MSITKRMLNEALYEEFVQNMIFGYADRSEEEMTIEDSYEEQWKEDFINLLENNNSVSNERKIEFEELPF